MFRLVIIVQYTVKETPSSVNPQWSCLSKSQLMKEASWRYWTRDLSSLVIYNLMTAEVSSGTSSEHAKASVRSVLRWEGWSKQNLLSRQVKVVIWLNNDRQAWLMLITGGEMKGMLYSGNAPQPSSETCWALPKCPGDDTGSQGQQQKTLKWEPRRKLVSVCMCPCQGQGQIPIWVALGLLFLVDTSATDSGDTAY